MVNYKLLSGILSVLLLTACSQSSAGNGTYTESNTVASVSAVQTTNTENKDNSKYVLDVEYTPIYDNVKFMDMSATGGPTTYEELQEYIDIYDDVSFVEYEILYQYTPEEAVEKTGSDIFKHSTTLYKAHVYYDHLNDTEVDLDVDISKAGMPNNQFKADPPYAVGQKLISALSGFNRTRCVAIPELVFYVYDVNGIDLAYHVNKNDIAVNNASFSNLNMELAESEFSLTTTTKNNPVEFNQKSAVEDLADFIRQDWSQRGYSFTDVKNVKANVLRTVEKEDYDVEVVD